MPQPNLDPTVKAGEQTGLPMSVVEARNRSVVKGEQWDNQTMTPYYNFKDHWGEWGLGTYENARSLGMKYVRA